MTHYLQACYVVPDLDAAIAEWRRVAKVGPVFIMSHVVPDNGLYRGKPTPLEMSCALFQTGPMQIELIEQHNDGPSVYRDMVPPGQTGFHHLCYFVDSLEAEIADRAALGIEAAYVASFGAVKFAYFDTRATLGSFTEILEREEGVLGLFQMVADAAVDWDGSDPIRYV